MLRNLRKTFQRQHIECVEQLRTQIARNEDEVEAKDGKHVARERFFKIRGRQHEVCDAVFFRVDMSIDAAQRVVCSNDVRQCHEDKLDDEAVGSFFNQISQ